MSNRALGRFVTLRTLAAVLTAGLALAACDGPMVYKSSSAAFGGASNVDNLVAQGTNATLIRNNPFPNDANNAAVFDVVKATYAGKRYKFVQGQPASDWNGYTMVVTFGENILGNNDSCKNPNPPLLLGPANRTSIIIDYCVGPTLITQVRGNTKAVSGPQDPQLVGLVNDMLADLFNPRISNRFEQSTPIWP